MQATSMRVFLYSFIVMLAYYSDAVQSQCDTNEVGKCASKFDDGSIDGLPKNPTLKEVKELCSIQKKFLDCLPEGCKNNYLPSYNLLCSGSSKAAIISTWTIIAAVVAVMFW